MGHLGCAGLCLVWKQTWVWWGWESYQNCTQVGQQKNVCGVEVKGGSVLGWGAEPF